MSQAAADQLTAEGHALFDEKRFVDAAARFERAVQIFPTHAAGWKGLGHCLLCLAKPTEAARAFDRAIGLRADSATALWGGALAHAELGHKMVAKDYLKRALRLQPDDPPSLLNLGHLRYRQGRMDDARAALARGDAIDFIPHTSWRDILICEQLRREAIALMPPSPSIATSRPAATQPVR